MFKPTHKKKTSINILPLIDVIFFLLVFFMLFTSFNSSPQGINLQLPKAVTVDQQKQKNMIVDITENGNIYYNGNQKTMAEIRKTAKNRYQENNKLVVIINADKESQYKHVVSLMDNLRKVGIYRLALAAEKDQS